MGIFSSTTLISFATPSHYKFQNDLHESTLDLFYTHRPYTSEWLEKQDFYKENKDIFDYKKYYGYFLWKPYIINFTLETIDSPYILYVDSNLTFLHHQLESFEKTFEYYMGNEGMFVPVCYDMYLNKYWTKRDAFILMNADEDKYADGYQTWTVIMGFDKSRKTCSLLRKYLDYCKDVRILTEIPNVLGKDDYEGFNAHRWEQSVMSILLIKYGVKGAPYSLVSKFIQKNYTPEIDKLKDVDPLEKRNA